LGQVCSRRHSEEATSEPAVQLQSGTFRFIQLHHVR